MAQPLARPLKPPSFDAIATDFLAWLKKEATPADGARAAAEQAEARSCWIVVGLLLAIGLSMRRHLVLLNQ